ncbi:YciI family protein [Aquabacter sp. CN5-332]|uniref:YciI family protein n=1 Tax=Aquabacter sp. CN5-332 TaxID=3156608 RepID=UPI0032B5B9E4
MSTPVVTAKEVADISRERGFLAKQLYVVFTTPTNGMGPVMANLKSHLDYQESLEKNGTMFAAGPHWTDDEQHWDGEGMVVVRASSMAEAEAIAAADPMHKSGARSYRVRPWLVNEGTLTVKLDFATGRFALD